MIKNKVKTFHKNSKLPITKNTIIYGSSDGGISVKSDESVSLIMRKLGEKLNLKDHMVGKEKNIIYGSLILLLFVLLFY